MNQANKANRRTLEKTGRQDEPADADAYNTWFHERVREAKTIRGRPLPARQSNATSLAVGLPQGENPPQAPSETGAGSCSARRALDHHSWHSIADTYPLEHLVGSPTACTSENKRRKGAFGRARLARYLFGGTCLALRVTKV